jgi:hypothetical protein
MPDYCQIRVSLGNAEAIAGGERGERERVTEIWGDLDRLFLQPSYYLASFLATRHVFIISLHLILDFTPTLRSNSRQRAPGARPRAGIEAETFVVVD